ncbi:MULTISPECIES: TetR family transcriptional regulator [unclassified Dysgonomonas]|uniref:TetR family transcriptional regulator n=1 Tax=unclassified Dysgonomonas TaxID=2630389 RepID=UPI0013E9DFD6|nr:MULTISPECIES: TetR family transcriptional regulator [unclassified Dysgonomonas]
MEEKDREKGKRIRRTNYEVERDIMNAVKNLVEERGFGNVTLSAVSQEAKVELPVIYSRYGNLNGMFEAFVEKYNFWLNSILENYIDDFKSGNYDIFLTKFLRDVTFELYKDKGMQQLILWEISENNAITSKTSKLREANTNMFVKFYENLFKDTDINFSALTALVMGGTYYLVLHRDSSTYCGVDFSTDEGKKELVDTIDKIYSWVFSLIQPNKQMQEVASKLKKRGVDFEIISESTGLSIEEISELA